MKHESVHLRPTALWLIFGPILGCMWVAAVNYSNNLVYAILYLVGALSFISLFHTWRNLAALRVEHIRIHPTFAGEPVRVEIFLRNTSQKTIYGFFFARINDESNDLSLRSTPLRTANNTGVRLEPGDSCSVETVIKKRQKVFRYGKSTNLPGEPIPKRRKLLGILPRPNLTKIIFIPGSGEQRGLYRFNSLLVRTSYPFGLVWASFRVPVDLDYYVYPKAEGSELWPALHPGNENGSPSSNRPGDDFSGVRAYMPGESLRHVDWKAFARGRPLSIKQFTGGSGQELWLDGAELERLPLEKRLSQLALWIVNAEKEEMPYALKLGRTTLPLGLGAVHSRRALEALAVAGVGSETA